MCLVHRGGLQIYLFFYHLAIRARQDVAQRQTCSWARSVRRCYGLLCWCSELKMDGPIRRPRQKLPFTIENILSRYPNSNGGRRSTGLEERAASPVLVQTEVFHCACLCCCCCSRCGDLLQADFSHEGELKYSWTTAKLLDPRRPGDPHRKEEENPGPVQRRTRRHRTIFTEEQLDALEELFLQNQYPDVNTREKLAQQTHLREERVEVMTNSSSFISGS